MNTTTRYAVAEYLEGIRIQATSYPTGELARAAMLRVAGLGIDSELWLVDVASRDAVMLATCRAYAGAVDELATVTA